MLQVNFVLATAVASWLLVSHVQCFYMATAPCEGGRAPGDKWFDGCQWCVCQPVGTVCTPGGCSHDQATVPPCENIGSEWRDGCFHCTCGMGEIECKANSVCSGPGGPNDALACMVPTNFQCVCGVDGVPLCSAEVIDRSEFTSAHVVFQGSSESSGSGHPKHHGSTHIVIHEKHFVPPRVKRSADVDDTMQRNKRSLSQTKHHSLLISTDPLCRFGPRWYGGSLRCYCDVSGSVTCGDPSFVASRIDGFLVESRMCEPGQLWEEEESCLTCQCQLLNLVICQRSSMCPLPSLVPDQQTEGKKVHSDSGDLHKKRDEDQIVDHSGHVGGLVDVSGEKVVIIVVNSKSDTELEVDEDDFEIDVDDEKKTAHHYTPVRECTPGSRWREGCTTCICSRNGRRNCDDSRCPKFFTGDLYPRPIPMPPPSPYPRPTQLPYRRPMQRPPPVLQTFLTRTEPISTRGETLMCGEFKVNEKYWIRCNLCECTHRGPRCTAKSCV